MRTCDVHEKRVCKSLGAKRQIGSGATPFLKADGVLSDMLIECKTRDKICKSISFQREWFEKLKREYISMNKDGGIVVFSFGDKNDYVAEEINDYIEKYEGFKKFKRLVEIIEDEEGKRSLERIVIDCRRILRDE